MDDSGAPSTVKAENNAPTDTRPSIDELLKQAERSPQVRRESQIARLNERQRLAAAVSSTLSAALELASYGEAGRLLLRDAPLETVVDEMIAAQARDRAQAEEDTAAAAAFVSTAVAPAPFVAATELEDDKPETPQGLDAWQPVYVVRSGNGWEVGWRRIDGSKRTSTRIGEPWRLDGDTVVVHGVGQRGSRRVIEVTINGEAYGVVLE